MLGRMGLRLIAGVAVALLTLAAPASATFRGADGRIFFAEHGIASMRPDGSDVRGVTSGADASPAVSADGALVAFDRYDPAAQRGLGIYVVRLRTGKVTHVRGTGNGNCCPSIGPDGHTLVYVESGPPGYGGVLHTVAVDGSRPRVLASTWGAWQPSFGPAGNTILFNGDDGYLHRVRVDGTREHRIPKSFGGMSASSSPDGRRIVFVRDDQVSVMRLRDHRVRTLTSDAFQKWNPIFSPSGNRIAFERFDTERGEDAKVGTWMIRTDGTQEHRILPVAVGQLAWQPQPLPR